MSHRWLDCLRVGPSCFFFDLVCGLKNLLVVLLEYFSLDLLNIPVDPRVFAVGVLSELALGVERPGLECTACDVPEDEEVLIGYHCVLTVRLEESCFFSNEGCFTSNRTDVNTVVFCALLLGSTELIELGQLIELH